MARNTSTNKEKASAQKASGNLSKSGTRRSAAARSRAVEAEPRILDDRTRRDIVGVGFIILGIVLFIAAAAPAGAIVTDFLSESLHVVFGVGCYIMPFFLVAIGGAVLYRMQSERMSLRVTLGLSLILVALLGIIALFTPTTGTGPAALFDRIALVTHGGYVGAALAWVGLTLFGPAISAILLIGVAIVGVIVIGFSISAFLEKVRARCDLDGEGAASLIPDAFGSMRRGRGKPPLTTMAESADLPPAAHGAPTARISLGEQPRRRSRGAAADAVPDAAVTRQLGAQKTDGLVPIQAPDPREVAEMERRLKMFSKCGVRNIITFNEKARAAQAADEAAEKRGEEPPENLYGEPIPYIVIVIDELADLMMNVGKEVEFSISRIAQLARAAGIHLIIATQRPSTNVVTGLIKANITCRIGLTVASGIDSRVILDSTGAENLIGMGDMLLAKPEYPKPIRIQGPYIPDDEIAAVVAHLKSQGEPEYHSEILKTNVVTLGDSSPSGEGGSEADDPLLWEAADVVVSSDLGSSSNLQRRLKVGYARAGRIMDQLEEKGIVGPANGSRPREVLVDQMELETLKAFEAADE